MTKTQIQKKINEKVLVYLKENFKDKEFRYVANLNIHQKGLEVYGFNSIPVYVLEKYGVVYYNF